MLNGHASAIERLRERTNRYMDISFNAVISILVKAFPYSCIEIKKSKISDHMVWVMIPEDALEGEGGLIYNFKESRAKCLTANWMKIFEDNFNAAIYRTAALMEKPIDDMSMEEMHQKEWLEYLRSNEVDAENQVYDQIADRLDLFSEDAYAQEKAMDDGWPISNTILTD